MTRLHLQRLAILDLSYGIAAGGVRITGLLRFASFGKGMHCSLGHPLFYAKIGIFLLGALLSIDPTMRLLSWRSMLTHDNLPEVDAKSMTRLRYLVRLERGLRLIIPLLAILIARGIRRRAS